MFKIIFGSFVAVYLFSCASASKDVHFRTRLPTMETPDVGRSNRFGFATAVESRRFHVTATDDLTSKYYFVKNDAKLQNGNDITIGGIDLEGTYTIPVVRTQILLSLDHAEFKTMLLDATDGGSGIKWTVNAGYYKTAAYESSGGGCSFICFSSESDQQKAKEIEDNISLDYSGEEKKIGTTIGYFFAPDLALYTGYNWMDARLKASAFKKSTGETISFSEALYGRGYGLGLLHIVIPRLVMGYSVEHIDMYWNSETYQATVFAYNLTFSF